jgi:hypothetical protein
VIPAFRFAGNRHCGIKESSDDGFPVDVFQIQPVLAFQRRIGMNQHVPLRIQHKDVALPLPPAAAGDTEIAKRCFSFAANQLCRVCHQSDKFASLLMLVGLFGFGGGLHLAVDATWQKDKNRNQRD